MPPDDGRGGNGLFIAITIALLAVLGVLIFFLAQAIGGGGDSSDDEDPVVATVEVPNVVGLTSVEAERTLGTLGLVADIQQVDDEADAGTVVGQFPPPGREVDEGEQITLQVSAGEALIRVPNVVGLDEDAALAELRDLGFVPSVTREASEDVDEGQVIRQDPAAGGELPEGSTVGIVISDGAELIELPDLAGQTDRQAEVTLASLQLGAVFRTEQNDEVEENVVIRTEPAAGSMVARGDEVVVIISEGPEILVIDDWSGSEPVVARAALEQQGFVVEIEQVDVPFGSPDAGRVIDTNPPAGASGLAGDRVILRVGNELPEPTTTTTTEPPPTTTEAPPDDDG